jgi:hypothetical protein
VVSDLLNPSIDLLQGFKVHSEEVKIFIRETYCNCHRGSPMA